MTLGLGTQTPAKDKFRAKAATAAKLKLPGTTARSRRWVFTVSALVLVAVVAIAMRVRTHNPGTEQQIRTAAVKRGDFARTLRLHGVVEAVEFYSVAAPRLAGPNFTLVITKLAPTGSNVKKGDLLVEFDRQTQQKNALDREAEYRDLEEQIAKKRADQAGILAADQTELTAAERAVQAATLELRKNEVVSQIDAEKNQQALEEAKAAYQQLKQTFDLKRQAAKAELRVLEIQRDRARNAMLHAQGNSDKMAIRSHIDGIVVLNTIWKSGRMAEVQEGDEVRPGTPFMQVVNPVTMQVRARVNQADVAYVRSGQQARVLLDAYPELKFTGKVGTVAAVGQTSGMSDRVRYFKVGIAIDGKDPKLMPDLSAAVDLELERRPGALIVPRDAVVNENGRTYAWIKQGGGWSQRAVTVGLTSDTEAMIQSGLDEGATVLRNPEVARTGQ